MITSIEQAIENLIKESGMANVVISGISCSGKTTLAREIKQAYAKQGQVGVICQDRYFKDLDEIPKTTKGYLTDSPNAFHRIEFVRDAKKLIESGSVLVPSYDIAQNKRAGVVTLIETDGINVFEGLHAISLLSELENSVKIFLNTSMEICLQRRIERDTKLYSISEERIREHWHNCIEPMCKSYILPQKKHADIVLA